MAYGFRRRAPPHLPRHLLFGILAYQLQADRLGDLDADSRRRTHSKKINELQLAAEQNRGRPGEVWEAIRKIPSIAYGLRNVLRLVDRGMKMSDIARPTGQS